MSEPNQQVQTPVEPEVINPPVEPTVEGQDPPVTTEPVEPQQVDPNEQFLIKATVEGREEIFDIRNPEQRKRVQDEIQKGIHYTKKMQALTELEKANQDQIQFSQGIVSDPDTLEILVAKENGLSPASLYGNPQPPDQSLAEVNPVLYSQQWLAYQTQIWERQKIKDLAKAKGTQQANTNNSALFERARIENDLNELEYNQIKNYMSMNFRPNIYGMFSKDQMDAAVMVITGKARQAQTQINTIAQIDKAIKSASQLTNVPVKNQPTPSPKKETEKFHQFVRDYINR